MNRLIIGIVGASALLVVIGSMVLAALGKTQPEGMADLAKVCLGGLIGIGTSETANALKPRDPQDPTPREKEEEDS